MAVPALRWIRDIAIMRRLARRALRGDAAARALAERTLLATPVHARRGAVSRLLAELDRERRRELRLQDGAARPLGPTTINRRAGEVLMAVGAREAVPALERMLARTPQTGEYAWSYGTEGWHLETFELDSHQALREMIRVLRGER